jgi:uncharacterized protein YidB (DUF937 family)
MFDPLVNELSQRYGLGDRGRDLFGLLMAYIHNDRRGGFGGFIEGFREQGHGELVSSWLGNPDAGGLNASDVGMVFGQGLLNDWGSRLGASRATVAAAIAGVLPRLVAELTPGGRIPGGFATPPPLGSEIARPVAEATRATAASCNIRPGVNGLVADEPIAARQAASPEDDLPDPGRIVPGDERRLAASGLGLPLAEPASQPLRREPVAASSAAVRTPVEARRGHDDARETLDPAERRLAEMTAAFDPRRREERHAGPVEAPPDDRTDEGWRPEGWRPAMHPPRRRSGWRWLFRLIVLLALLAGAGWFAWAQGWLDPYIDQLNLPIRSTPSPL